jgi:hypothetical protein
MSPQGRPEGGFGADRSQVSQVTALATPFAWPASGLDPLPWFPFTVAVSRDATVAGERAAQCAERAYWHLRRLFGVAPRFRLLVLAPADWPRYAEEAAYGVGHATRAGHLVVGSEPAAEWHAVSRFLAQHLPAAALRHLVKVHGPDRLHPAAPDLAGVADALVAHELAHLVARQAGAAFPRRWLAHAFANYALVAVLAETEPAALHRLGSLAEATRPLADLAPTVAQFEAADGALAPAQAVLVQLALTRAAFAAYAEASVAPLQHWFAAARSGGQAPIADHEIARHLHRIHPALAALAPEHIDARGTSVRAA